MKRCPNCNLAYSDHTLEFCLEDGTRLISEHSIETEIPTVTLPNKFSLITEKTDNLPYSDSIKTLEIGKDAASASPQTNSIKEKVVQQSINVIEMAPVVVALAHNWWQWIYLNNQYYTSFSTYVLSANFLMWLLLLITGTVISLCAVKRGQNRGFAFASLVILSINLILFLVPKR